MIVRVSVTGQVRRPGTVTAACVMLVLGGLLYAGEIYRAAQHFFRTTAIGGAVGGVAIGFHWLVEISGIFAGFAVALLAGPAFAGLAWARAVSWVFGLPMLIWYGVATFFNSLIDDWVSPLDTALTAAAGVLLILALVCQTVPRSDAYFRRPRRDKAF
jgi:hypothetical protein